MAKVKVKIAMVRDQEMSRGVNTLPELESFELNQ